MFVPKIPMAANTFGQRITAAYCPRPRGPSSLAMMIPCRTVKHWTTTLVPNVRTYARRPICLRTGVANAGADPAITLELVHESVFICVHLRSSAVGNQFDSITV